MIDKTGDTCSRGASKATRAGPTLLPVMSMVKLSLGGMSFDFNFILSLILEYVN